MKKQKKTIKKALKQQNRKKQKRFYKNLTKQKGGSMKKQNLIKNNKTKSGFFKIPNLIKSLKTGKSLILTTSHHDQFLKDSSLKSLMLKSYLNSYLALKSLHNATLKALRLRKEYLKLTGWTSFYPFTLNISPINKSRSLFL